MTKRTGFCRVCETPVLPLRLRCDPCNRRYQWVRRRLDDEVHRARWHHKGRQAIPITPLETRQAEAERLRRKRTDPVYVEQERRKNRERMRRVRTAGEITPATP